MDTKADIAASRRGFISTIMGLVPGILLATPKRLRAVGPEIKNILCHMEVETLKSSRLKRNPSVICSTLGDTSTLYTERGQAREIVCSMNLMGNIIWEACDGNRDLEDISRLIHKRYLVSKRRATLDTFVFLKSLKQIGAIL